MRQTKDGAKLNQSLKKAASLLRAVAADDNASVSSLARDAGLPRATALRLIQTLESEGFLVRVDGDRVLLGPELFRLTSIADSQDVVRQVARPVLDELVATVNETVTLSVLTSPGRLDVVEQIDAPNQLGPTSWLGENFPLHASATGKVYLATWADETVSKFLRTPLQRFTPHTIVTAHAIRTELRSVRRRRFAVARDEHEEGLTGIAAGVHGPSEELQGVICISGPTQRLDGDRGERATVQLLRAADRIDELLRPADRQTGS